ncbi:MAG: class I SAM-dependent methyltransferase [Patescibacteria group bacterium]
MFTGERILPGGKFNVTYQESLFAYDFARQRAAGKCVLDVGSGEGYGAAYVAQQAQEVVALDPHTGTVQEAKQKYRATNLSFFSGTLDSPPSEIKEKQFDVVCCFQTVEHVQDQDQFLQQLKAQAASGGEVIITTPNAERFPGFNPYHIKELTPAQLTDLVKRHFSRFELYGVFGNEGVLRYKRAKQHFNDMMLRADFLRAREWLPRPLVFGLYTLGAGAIKSLSYRAEKAHVDEVTLSSFWVGKDRLEEALDLLVIGYANER